MKPLPEVVDRQISKAVSLLLSSVQVRPTFWKERADAVRPEGVAGGCPLTTAASEKALLGIVAKVVPELGVFQARVMAPLPLVPWK